MEITVAIICSSDVLISKCLKSISESTRILVILNNPSEKILDIVSNDSRVKTLRHDNLNLGYLRQLAADNIETKGILYIDSDCVFEKGTIEIVSSELEEFSAVSIPMRYKRESLSTSIVSKCREFTTPDSALFIPAAFRIDLQEKIGGYLYDKRLAWGEDSDQKKRLLKNNISFKISKGLIWHCALNFCSDVKSAVRLGQGRVLQEKYGYFPKRNFWKDILPFNDIRLSVKCAKKVGFLPSLYHLLVWRPAYKYGYWIRGRKIHGN